MHRRPNKRRRDKNVSRKLRFQALIERTGIRKDEPETVAVHAESSDYQILASGGFRNRVAVRIYLHKLAASRELVQFLLQLAAGFSVQSQFTHQLFESGSVPGLAVDVAQNVRVGDHTVGISIAG